MDKKSAEYVRGLGVYRIFDGAVLSYKIGIIKPSAGIYRYALKRFKLKPNECIFIDNRPANVRGAKKIGIKNYITLLPSANSLGASARVIRITSMVKKM